VTLPYEELTGLIIEQAKAIHRDLGPGQNKDRYARELQAALYARDVKARRSLDVHRGPKGRGRPIGTLDLMVERTVGVTIVKGSGKPTARQRQTLRKLCEVQDLPVGLVLSFTPYGVWPGRA
jgi:hypothetical protein